MMNKELLLNRITGLGGLLLLMMFGVLNAQTRNLNTAKTQSSQILKQTSQDSSKELKVVDGDPLELMKGKAEDISKRDAFSKHYKNTDGSMTALIGSGPIHYFTNGSYENIETKITSQTDAVYSFANKTNLFESYFGATSNSGIKNKTIEGEVKEFLNTQMYWEVNGQPQGLINSANVPATIDGNKAYYKNIYGSISAEFTSLVGKRKLNYIIPNKQALGNIPLGADYLVFSEEVILPQGWKHTITEDGILIKNQLGKEIYLYDNPTSTDAANEMLSEQNTVFETLLIGNTLTIKTKVKTAWLLNSQRQFPVKVDPTITVYPNATTHRTAQMGASGFGAYGNIAVGYNGGYYRSYATFNTISIADNSTISNTTLYHKVRTTQFMSTGSDGGTRGSEIRAFLTNPETYATWLSVYNAVSNTTVSPTLYTTVLNLGTLGWKNVSLGATANTDLKNGLVNDRFTIGYRPAGAYNTATRAEFATIFGENTGADTPYLSITYAEANTPPSCATIVAPLNGSVGNAHQGALSWNAVAGATGYDVYFGTSTTPPLVSTNQTATTYTLPSCLLPLTTYYWRVVPRNANGSATGCATWSFTTDNKLHIYKNDWETATLGYFGTSGLSVDGWYTNTNSGNGTYNNTWTVGTGVNAISGKSVGISAMTNGGLSGNYFEYWYDLGELHRWIYRPFNLTGLRDVELSFKWKSGGETNQDYGSVISSINGGATWLMDSQGGLNNDGRYLNSPTTIRTQTITLPATRNNQSNFQLSFKWDDMSGNSSGTDPSFVVDDIVIKACPYEGMINSTAVSSGVYEWSPTGSTQTSLSIEGTHQCAQFQWEQSTDSGVTWINAAGGSGADTISYTTPSNLSADTWYRCKVYFSTGCLGVYQANIFKILFCDKLWSSTSSTDWAISTNWTPNGIPTAKHCVKIPSNPIKPIILNGTMGLAKSLEITSGGGLTINKDASLTVTDFIKNNSTAADFIIESDGNLVQVNPLPANTGNITLKRISKMKRLDYIYWGSPVAGQNFINFSPNTIASRFYRYNEEFDSFHTISNLNDKMIAGEGYAIRAPNNQSTTTSTPWTGIFVGKPNNGQITIPVTKSPDSHTNPDDTSTPWIARGKNMLSNPYPSNLDLEALTTGNPSTANGVYYFWTNTPDFANNTNVPGNGQYGNYGSNHYATYSSSGAVQAANTDTQLPTRYIRPGQGFLFEAKSGGTVTFNNSMRSIDSNSTFISNKGTENSPERFWLKLTTPINNTNTLLIAYIQGATNSFEPRYDARFPQKSSDRFYSVIEDQELIIQGRQYPFVKTDLVPLGMEHFVAGNYKIEIADREGIFATGQNIYLKDRQTGIITNLSQGSYSYTAEAGENNTRFEIIYEPETVLVANENVKGECIVYRDASDFVVKSSDQTIENIELYDASGRLVLKLKGNNTKELRFSAEKLHEGMYVLKVITKAGVITKKIIKY